MTEQRNPDFVDQQSVRAAERIYHQWDEALGAKDVDAVIALYAPDCALESPLVRHLLSSAEGVVAGREKLREFVQMVFAHQPAARQRYRKGFFTDGRTLMWEYPRAKPDGANGRRRGDGDPGRIDPSPPGLLGLVWPQAAARGRSSRQMTACGPSWRRFRPLLSIFDAGAWRRRSQQ
jgi:SnoaL-like domain